MGFLPIGSFTTLFPVLEELLKSLDATYEHILETINQATGVYARRLSQCLTVAVRPLRFKELGEILAFDLDKAPRLLSPMQIGGGKIRNALLDNANLGPSGSDREHFIPPYRNRTDVYDTRTRLLWRLFAF